MQGTVFSGQSKNICGRRHFCLIAAFFFIAEDLPAYSGNRGDENMNSVMTYVGILLGLVVVCGLLARWAKWVWKICYSGILGMAGLICFNFVMTPFQMAIGVNVVTSFICGFLGLPGLAALMAAKYLILA